MRSHSGLAHKQRGITFIGLLFVAVIVGFLMIVAAKTVPTVIEYQAIVKAINKAKDNETVAEIERSFNAAAAIDDFTAVRAEDLVITKENGQVMIEFAYDKEIKLMGPVSLLIHYSGSTKGK
ncbi:MAG: DUF4845 domain-containing protein [Brachymonas sp.]|nr:DUF4845 domain-containing protein [Brachymonas sp.]